MLSSLFEDLDFLYSTLDAYIDDAKKDNRDI
jgi:hypothetical protein